ncbi:hypothetical protein EDD16DRAFT_1464940, partial [Pisolithus croceorrhizus]
PVPIHTLLKSYSVTVLIANYGMLGLVDIVFFTLVPLFHGIPVVIGGLGLPSFIIGMIMMAFRVVNGFSQVLFTAR